jgi:hypothetical protein
MDGAADSITHSVVLGVIGGAAFSDLVLVSSASWRRSFR